MAINFPSATEVPKNNAVAENLGSEPAQNLSSKKNVLKKEAVTFDEIVDNTVDLWHAWQKL